MMGITTLKTFIKTILLCFCGQDEGDAAGARRQEEAQPHGRAQVNIISALRDNVLVDPIMRQAKD